VEEENCDSDSGGCAEGEGCAERWAAERGVPMVHDDRYGENADCENICGAYECGQSEEQTGGGCSLE